MAIRLKSKWLYMGGSNGYGLVHTVIAVSGMNITTWSDPDQDTEDDVGYTWSGKRNDFLETFRPLGPIEEPDLES